MLLRGLMLVFNFMGDHRMSFGKYAVALLVASTAIACQKNDADRDPENRVEPVVTNDTDDNDNDNDNDNDDKVVATTEARHDSDRAASGSTEPSTNAVDAVPGAQGSAIQSITQARCEREKRCENIGKGKKFDSMAKCVSEIRETWKDELNTRECRGGVVQKELQECLEEVRNQDCNNPFDALSRVMACREGDICKALN
jgi:hypothetical protein